MTMDGPMDELADGPMDGPMGEPLDGLAEELVLQPVAQASGVVRRRRVAAAATAVAVTTAAVVTALVAGSGDDGPTPQQRAGDSLGGAATPSPTAEPTEDATPTPTPEATVAVEESAEPRATEDARQSAEPSESSERVGNVGSGGNCYTSPPDNSRQASSHPSESPTATPTATPTDTTVEPTDPAPSSASASSSADPEATEPTATPTPTGSAYTYCVVVGRPMWRDGDLLVPEVRSGGSNDDLPRPDVTGLDPRDRAALAELWTQAARGALASVPAFHDLALVLSALGAPLVLIARATQAAMDEVDHTRRSFAIAGTYAGAPVEGGAVPGLLGRRVGQASTPRAALTRLAVEALRDGCLYEGHAATVARLAADTATDPGVRESLDVIATDEAGHAVLSHDLLAWCLATGDSRLRTRITKELAALPTEAPASPTADGQPGVLEQHGWPTRAAVVRAFEVHRTALVARVEGLLVGSL